ncbi:MAG: ABC transporter ATP-binding protein [Candidatus Hermodarchaeota archaeon]
MTKNQNKEKISDVYLLKRLAKYLFHNRMMNIAAFSLLILDLGFGLFIPYLMSLILDDYISQGVMVTELFSIIGIYFVFFLLGTIFNFLGNYIFGIMGENAIYQLRKDTYSKIQELGLDYFDETPTGDTLSRMTNDMDLMQPILSGQVVYAMYSLIFVVGMLGVLFSISPVLTVLVSITIPLVIIILYVNNKWTRTLRKKANEKLANVSASMTEHIMGVKVSTAFAREEYNIEDFKKVNDEYADQFMKFYKFGSFLHPLFLIFNFIAIFLVLFFGSIIVITNLDASAGLTVGTIYLFVLYVTRFSGPIIQVSSIFGNIQVALASFERIIKLHIRPSSVPESPTAVPLNCTQGEIDFRNVTFAYNESQGNILENFNIHISPNECVAIVGETGSGKTTIAYLLARLYDIQQGNILIDGQDIRDITKESLRQALCMVPQEPFLFSESIISNLYYGAECSPAELNTYVTLLGCDFVFNLSNELDTNVGERGGRLSVGQRQLLTFARALIPNPKILILDEATSSIDPQTELQIQRAMDEMLKNRTSIIIAHRLSTIRKADRILVLNNGKIIEEGSFEALIDMKGEFYNLYQLQFNNEGIY